LEVPVLSTTVFSTKEAAEYCNVSSETIRRWIRKKGLIAYNTGKRIRIKIKKEDLDDFVAKNNILTKE
jgi:excisionase family DNA binding protein